MTKMQMVRTRTSSELIARREGGREGAVNMYEGMSREGRVVVCRECAVGMQGVAILTLIDDGEFRE